MEGFLKLSTAKDITVLMIDSSDHVTGKTGLSAGLTIYATKAGGTPAVITPTVTELDSTNVKGQYKLAFTSSHTDTLGELQLHITGSGADPTDLKWQVCTYLPGEAATLQADQAVNVTKVNGTSQTAGDLAALSNTIATYIDTEVAAIKAKTDGLPSDPADASDIAASFSTVNATLAVIAAYIDTEVAAIKAKTDNLPASPAAVGSAMTLTGAYDFAKGTVAMTEAYAADGAAYTPAQAFFMLVQLMIERSISGTTLTIKKLDKSTTAMTATLDSGSSPTSQTRAT